MGKAMTRRSFFKFAAALPVVCWFAGQVGAAVDDGSSPHVYHDNVLTEQDLREAYERELSGMHRTTMGLKKYIETYSRWPTDMLGAGR